MPNAIRAQRRAHRLALGAKVALEQRRLEPLLHGVALGVGQELKHSHQLVSRQVVAVGAARRLLQILDLLHLRRDALELRWLELERHLVPPLWRELIEDLVLALADHRNAEDLAQLRLILLAHAHPPVDVTEAGVDLRVLAAVPTTPRTERRERARPADGGEERM